MSDPLPAMPSNGFGTTNTRRELAAGVMIHYERTEPSGSPWKTVDELFDRDLDRLREACRSELQCLSLIYRDSGKDG